MSGQRSYLGKGTFAVVVVVLVATAVSLAGARARIGLLLEQRDSLELVSEAAIEASEEATAELGVSFELAALERELAEERLVVADERVETAEQAAEASFRSTAALFERGSAAERAVEEMRGDAIVVSMEHEAREDVSAAALLRAQNRIIELEGGVDDLVDAFDVERAAWNAERSITAQIIAEYQNVIAPSFFRRIFDMPEVALVGAVLGAGLTCAAVC